MEKFKTTYGDSITKYEVIKETEKQITFINKWINWDKIEQSREVRENKDSSYHKWHDTFEEAKNYLIEYNKKQIENLETQIIKAKEKLSKVQSLPCKTFTYINNENEVEGRYQYGGEWFKL